MARCIGGDPENCDNLDCPVHGEDLRANLPDCDKCAGVLKAEYTHIGCCNYCGADLCDECYNDNWATCANCETDRCFDCHSLCPEHD